MMTTSTRLWATALASALALSVSAPVFAGTMRTLGHDVRHRQLANQAEFASVGRMEVLTQPAPGTPILGSGVLIGGRYVLTAAHVVDEAIAIEFNINGRSYTGSRWVIQRGFNNNFAEGNDIAVVELDQRVASARNIKARINRSRKEFGKTATIVGYGSTGDGTTGNLFAAGRKRAGRNTVDIRNAFARRQIAVDFDPGPTHSIFNTIANPDFDDLAGRVLNIQKDDFAIPDEYLSATGDSGGGLFIGGRVAGITSWGSSTSQFFGQGYFTRVSRWANWITRQKRSFKNSVANPFAGVLTHDDGTGTFVDFGSPGDPIVTSPDTDVFPPIFSNLFGDPGNTQAGRIAKNRIIPSTYLDSGAVVPEPASLALLSLGILAALRRTRR